MKTLKHLFLDLEDTIIFPVMNGWNDTHLVNVEKIKAFIADFKPDQVHIFSFAIWNQRELKGFMNGTRMMIQDALGVKFTVVPTVDDDIIPRCCDMMGLNRSTVDFQEMSNFWGKHEAFRLFVRSKLQTGWVKWKIESEVVLLDDAVWDENFEWPDLHVKGRIINIDKMQ